jgi:geranylgeranylglycerol-phosphate geranylgeranyltransferase
MKKKVKNFKLIITKPFVFLSNWRSLPLFEMLSYFLMYASIPMLAYGFNIYDYDIISIILLTILTMYSGFFAALIWNDITDSEIDIISHPDRPIPSGRISQRNFFNIALFFSFLTFIFSFLVNFWCFIIVIITAFFVAIHNKYLKKIVKFPAYSEIFTPIQWIVVVVFGYFAIWTNFHYHNSLVFQTPIFENIYTSMSEFQNMILLVLFTYFIDNAHDLPEGIHDFQGDLKLGVKTYATSFGKRNAAKISFFMFLISGLLGIMIYLNTILSYIFLIPFLIIWIYTLYFSFSLLKKGDNEIEKYGMIVGRKGFNFLLLSFDLIFVDIMIQLIIMNS